jgi:hypothetical protein
MQLQLTGLENVDTNVLSAENAGTLNASTVERHGKCEYQVMFSLKKVKI